MVSSVLAESVVCRIKSPYLRNNIIAEEQKNVRDCHVEDSECTTTDKCKIEFVPSNAFCPVTGQYKWEVETIDLSEYDNGKGNTSATGNAYYATCAINETFGTATSKDEFYCDTNYKQGSCGTSSGLKCYQCNCFDYDEYPLFCSDGTAVGDCSCSNLGMRCEVNQTKEKYTDINKALILNDRCHECGDTCPIGKKCLVGPNNITFLENFQIPKTLTIQNQDGDVSYGQANNLQFHSSPYSYWISKTNDEGYARVIITDSAKIGGSDTHSAIAWVYSNQPEATRIVVLKDGAIVASSPYNKITKVWEKLKATFIPSSNSYIVAIEVAKQADVYIDDVSFAQWAYGCMGVCADNTPWGECSATQIGKICGENSQLSSACDRCGCPGGQYCDLKTKTCMVPANLTFTGTVTPSVTVGNTVNININVRNPFFIDKYAKVTCELSGPLGLKTVSSECKVVKNSTSTVPYTIYSFNYTIDNNTSAKGLWNVSCWIDDSMNADCSNPRISDSQYIGNVTVSLLGCSDGTPDGICSPFNKGKKCVNGVLVDSCEECFAKTGCPQNQGCDPTTHRCNDCSSIVAPDTYPPVLTRGEEKCTQTRGILKQINKTINGFDTGCALDYTCDCSAVGSYSDTNGCFESCDNDGTCEQWERASCSDCSVYFVNNTYDETNYGLKFSATMTQNLFNPVFRVCRDVPITQCENAFTSENLNSCGVSGSCLCGQANIAIGDKYSCRVSCYDTSGKYYVLVTGTLGTNSVKIASDYFDFVCPSLNISQLSRYAEVFRTMHERASIVVMQSYDNMLINATADEVCLEKGIADGEDCWRYHMTINQEVKAIAAEMIIYLKPIINGTNTTKESAQEGFAKINESMQKIRDIYGAGYVILKLGEINSIDKIMLNQVVLINTTVQNTGAESRYGYIKCEIKPPGLSLLNTTSSCLNIEGGSTVEFELNFTPNKLGNWSITRCWLMGSLDSACSVNGTYDTKAVNKIVQVVNDTKTTILNVNIMTEMILNNTEANINITVNPGVYDRYVFSYCNLAGPHSNKVMQSDCKFVNASAGPVSFIPAIILDEIGNWSILNCDINASLASDCGNSWFEDRRTNIGRISVETTPPNMTITRTAIQGASFNGVAVVNVTVRNPALNRYANVGCNIIKPDSTISTIATICTPIQGGSSYIFKLNVTADQIGVWLVDSCYVNVSYVNNCNNAVIQDIKSDIGGFIIYNLSIISISSPGILDVGQTATVNVGVRNRGAESFQIFVNCTFVDPDNVQYTVKSDDTSIGPDEEKTISLGMVVSKAGEWKIKSCNLYWI